MLQDEIISAVISLKDYCSYFGKKIATKSFYSEDECDACYEQFGLACRLIEALETYNVAPESYLSDGDNSVCNILTEEEVRSLIEISAGILKKKE